MKPVTFGKPFRGLSRRETGKSLSGSRIFLYKLILQPLACFRQAVPVPVLADNATGGNESFIPCAAFKVGNGNADTDPICMEELSVPNINAHVVDFSVSIRVREYQIARLQLILGNDSADRSLLSGGTRKVDSVLLVHILSKRRAIKNIRSSSRRRILITDS